MQQSIVHALSQVLNGELEEVQIYNALTQALNFSDSSLTWSVNDRAVASVNDYS